MKLRLLFVFILMCSFSVFVPAQEMENQYIKVIPDRIYTSIEQALSNPDSVFRLDLSRKNLKIFPHQVFQLKNLYELNISRNRLKEIPAEIGKLTHLKILKASNNKLKSLPPEIGSLIQLTTLELNRNLIVTLPPQISQLVHLEKIELWDNEIDSLPDEIKNLKQLKVLELRGILFTDEDQKKIKTLLPDARIYFSPSCLCKD